MIILREVTDWSDSKHPVKNHDYLVDDNKEFCIAYRKAGTDDWERFKKHKRFVRTRRKFKRLKEETPINFIKPYMVDPWKNKSYNSLEAYFE